jgi:hypothetical protein
VGVTETIRKPWTEQAGSGPQSGRAARLEDPRSDRSGAHGILLDRVGHRAYRSHVARLIRSRIAVVVLALAACGCTAGCGTRTALCDGTSKCYAGQAEVPCSCGDACGHGYFCHTPRDTCIDDSDCGNQGVCNYDTVNKMWSCSLCWPVP